MLSPELMLVLTLVVPAAAVIGIVAFDSFPNRREGVTIAASLVLIFLVSRLYALVKGGATVAVAGPELFPGLSLSFAIEPLGLLFSLVAGYLWLVTTIYAIGYMRGHHEQKIGRASCRERV